MDVWHCGGAQLVVISPHTGISRTALASYVVGDQVCIACVCVLDLSIGYMVMYILVQIGVFVFVRCHLHASTNMHHTNILLQDKLRTLEGIVHPLVTKARAAVVASCQSDVIVFDIPLLFETNAQKEVLHTGCVFVAWIVTLCFYMVPQTQTPVARLPFFKQTLVPLAHTSIQTHKHAQVDIVVVVSAPADVQRDRVLARPGMTLGTCLFVFLCMCSVSVFCVAVCLCLFVCMCFVCPHLARLVYIPTHTCFPTHTCSHTHAQQTQINFMHCYQDRSRMMKSVNVLITSSTR